MQEDMIIRKSWEDDDLKIIEDFIKENPDISYYRAGKILSQKLNRSPGSISSKLYKIFEETRDQVRGKIKIGNVAVSLEKLKDDLNDVTEIMANLKNDVDEIEDVVNSLEKWVLETLKIRERLLGYTVEKNGVVSDIKIDQE